MPINLVGGQSPSLMQLMKDKRSALRDLVSAVESGDMTTAQSKAATIQSDQSQIDAIVGSAASTGGTSAAPDPRSKVKADLTSLLAAVQGGDRTQASAALAQLQADRPIGAPGGDADADGRVAGSSPSRKSLVTDLKSMLSAIVSGDTTGASSYATALQSDLDTVLGTPSAAPASSAGSATTPAGSGASGSFLDDLKSLISAVQSGDGANTQTAAGTLAGDVGAMLGAFRDGGHHGRHRHAEGAPDPQSIFGLLNSAARSSSTTSTSPTASSSAA